MVHPVGQSDSANLAYADHRPDAPTYRGLSEVLELHGSTDASQTEVAGFGSRAAEAISAHSASNAHPYMDIPGKRGKPKGSDTGSYRVLTEAQASRPGRR